MTRNQIEYQRNLETQRTNRAIEGLRGAELAETIQHNRKTESELGRHNLASETLDHFKATSLDAHYKRMDDAQLQQIAETIAHNKVNELNDEARIRFDANYGFSKLRNDIYSALLRSGGTWQSVAGIAGASIDQIMNGGVFDPFAEVTGVGRQTATDSDRRHYTVSLRGNEVDVPNDQSVSPSATQRPAYTLSQSIQSGTNAVRDVMNHINEGLARQTTGLSAEVRQGIHLSPYETQKRISQSQAARGSRDVSKPTRSQAVDALWGRHS